MTFGHRSCEAGAANASIAAMAFVLPANNERIVAATAPLATVGQWYALPPRFERRESELLAACSPADPTLPGSTPWFMR